MLQYSQSINHYTLLNLTKLDVLDSFDSIRVGVEYKIDGKSVPFPDNGTDLSRVEVVYEELRGWRRSIKDIRSWEELPEEAKAYVEFIEEKLGTRVKWVG